MSRGEFSHLVVLHKRVTRGGAPSALCGRFKVRDGQLVSDDSQVTCLRCAKRLEVNREVLRLWSQQQQRRFDD